jgi:hypothetical protein
MPAPSTPTTFQRPDLGMAFEEFDLLASQKGFIGQQVLPIMSVALQTANFSKIKVKSLLTERNTLRAPGGGYSRQDWEFEQDSYATKEYGAEEVLDDRERAIYRYTIDFERIASMRAMDAILRDYEKRVAAAVFNAVTFTPVPVTTEWSKTNSTPVADVLANTTTFKGQMGRLPNALIISDKVLRNLQLNEEIIDRLKYSGVDDPKKVTLQMLAALFNLDKIIVPNAMRNSANPGQAAAFADIWDDEYAMLCVIATSQDLKEPCLGRTFHFTGDGSSESGTFETYRYEPNRSDIMRCRHDVQEKILYTAAGLLMSNITE